MRMRSVAIVIVAATAALAAATAAADASSIAIPSLRAATVYKTLRIQDFECAGPAKKHGKSVWTCTKKARQANYVVTMEGSSPAQLTMIRGIARVRTAKPDPLAASFLGYLATVPYRGANPNKARTWVRKHVKGGKTKIGAVTFRVSGAARSRAIEITA